MVQTVGDRLRPADAQQAEVHMLWTDSQVDVDASHIATIVAGMRAVAGADGEVHASELALIDTLERDIPHGTAAGPLDGAALKEIYLHSLVGVALADGVVTAAERGVIVDLASAQGFGEDVVDAAIVAVKKQFLQAFSGVKVFRDDVVDIARELGLSEDDVDDLG